MQPPLRVHLCPVGFERDRILLPVLQQKADLVYVIVREPERDAAHHAEFLMAALATAGVEVRQERCPYEMYALLNLFGRLIQAHPGQHVFVNISTGGTIAAVAGTLAAMMWGAQPYHVEPERYIDTQRPLAVMEQALRAKDLKAAQALLRDELQAHKTATGGAPNLISVGVRTILEIPQYRLETPGEHLLRALRFLGQRQQQGRRTRKKDLIRFLQEHQPQEFETERVSHGMSEQQKYGVLQSRYLGPLQEWGYLDAGGVRSSAWLRVTDKGFNALRIFQGLWEVGPAAG